MTFIYWLLILIVPLLIGCAIHNHFATKREQESADHIQSQIEFLEARFENARNRFWSMASTRSRGFLLPEQTHELEEIVADVAWLEEKKRRVLGEWG